MGPPPRRRRRRTTAGCRKDCHGGIRRLPNKTETSGRCSTLLRRFWNMARRNFKKCLLEIKRHPSAPHLRPSVWCHYQKPVVYDAWRPDLSLDILLVRYSKAQVKLLLPAISDSWSRERALDRLLGLQHRRELVNQTKQARYLPRFVWEFLNP